MGPGDLAEALAGLPLQSDPNLIAGIERAEDAGVYKLTDELAIVQTIDFFTPIVDDPYTFGRIAAVNALSDVYAMGGRPLTAMNIVCFPQKTMPMSVLREILAGGIDILHGADVTLVGGHSVEDTELKFGLSVTGIIHPARVIFNIGAKVGDRLVLTKPLGTGIISTAIKAGVAEEVTIAGAVRSMTTLNRKPSELMQEVGVSACTDITGFGLLGHAAEMIDKTDVGLLIAAGAVPLLSGAKELVEKGMTPGGLRRNRDFRKGMVDFDAHVPEYLADILFDPQTSGGLLISLPEKKAVALLGGLRDAGVTGAVVIGEVVAEPKGRIVVR